jgi:hypothetical protein
MKSFAERVKNMPVEISDAVSFMKIAEKAEICRVLRHGDEVKLKLRTSRKLYTMKMEASAADEFLKDLKCKVEELTKEKKNKPQKEKASTPHEIQE